MLGLQHALLLSPHMVLPLLVYRAAGAPVEAATWAAAWSLLMGGLMTLAQMRATGFLCPSNVASAVYLAPCLAAARLGGLPLVAGMLLGAGFTEVLLSRLLPYLKRLFTEAMGGLVISLIAIELGALGARKLLVMDGSPQLQDLAGGGVALVVMALCSWRGRGWLRLLGTLWGLAAGTLVSALLGRLSPQAWESVGQAAWVAGPGLSWPRLAWSWELAPTFALAGLAGTLKAVASVTLCHKVNELPLEPRRVRRGVLADGLGTMAAACLGTLGVNPAPAAVGLERTTGATSRSLSWAVAAWLVGLALLPKLVALFNAVPESVMGAVLLFIAAGMLAGGLSLMQTESPELMTLALLMGLSREAFPDYYRSLSPAWQALADSPLSVGVFTALLGTWLLPPGRAHDP